MKTFALSTLLVVGLSVAAPAFGATPVYNSKANSPAITRTSSVDTSPMAFDGRGTNSKLGSTVVGVNSINVMPSTFHDECTKCSS